MSLTLVEISELTPINETDMDKVLDLSEAMKSPEFEAPSILFSENHNRAVTGSHRIQAARILVCLDENTDSEFSEILIPSIDVDEYIDKYCEENDCAFDELPFDNLRAIFEGTEIEDDVSKNEEW